MNIICALIGHKTDENSDYGDEICKRCKSHSCSDWHKDKWGRMPLLKGFWYDICNFISKPFKKKDKDDILPF